MRRSASDVIPSAIVLATGINGLGAVRSLGMAGLPHVALYQGRWNPVRWSRYPDAAQLVPDNWTDESLLEQIKRHAHKYASIFSCSDAFSDFLSRQHQSLSDVGLRVISPPVGVSELLNDKAREVALIAAAGVTIPRSVNPLPRTAEEFEAVLKLPAIIKPRSHAHSELIRTKNVIVRSSADLARFLQAQAHVLDAFVAQEVVEGPDEALWVCHCVFGPFGEMVQGFTFQRIRLSPPHFGVTSFAVARENAEVLEASARIGKAVGYEGLAMMEYKYDTASKQYYYIETNPRIGMCNVLDTTCGVNNVATAVSIACGAGKPMPVAQQNQRYYLNVLADLESRISEREPLGVIVGSYLRARRHPMAWAFWSARDPLPWVLASATGTWNIARRVVVKLLKYRR